MIVVLVVVAAAAAGIGVEHAAAVAAVVAVVAIAAASASASSVLYSYLRVFFALFFYLRSCGAVEETRRKRNDLLIKWPLVHLTMAGPVPFAISRNLAFKSKSIKVHIFCEYFYKGSRLSSISPAFANA